ncbi:unnamed protein product [Durusdinium trenchii]|uniref:Uncharacterized protein n=1 Tax=Durusdinium trenchii TaxID=1381693 RepID=A0ABP0N089_9DINO
MFNDNGNDLEVDLPTSPSSESNLVPSDNDDSQRVLEGDVHLPSLPESESEDGGSEVQDPAPKRSKNDAPVRVHTLVGNFKALEKAILSNPKQVQPIPRQLVSEVFSPPRVTAVAQRWAHNDDAIFAFDITYNGWDCLDMHMRAQLKKMIHALRPKLLVLSPPCTMFSALTRMWNVKLWTEEEYDDRMAKAELMFNYALELCELQSSKQLGFVLENPVAMTKMLSEFGGPENYLRIRFASQDQLNEWLNYLVHHVPLDASDFNFSADLPVTNLSNMSQAQSFRVHPAMFSYAAESSIKGPAENDTVLLMLEEILTDGFMTANEPLLLIQSETLAKGHPELISAPWRTSSGTALPFTLGYFKGKTRVAVLMSLLSIARDLKLDNWAEVRDNNRQASKTGQLLGMKAQAVRNIMEHFDREARKLLIDYTVNVGHENTPWTDDNLSSKKCLPGFQFKSNAGPVWQARGKVTDVKHQINSHRKIPANLRKKLDKKQMESLSEEAAFVVAVKAEVLQAMPVDPNALHTGWVELYENGDPGVVLEVQSAIMNRSCPNVSEIATLASIMNKHTGSTPLPSKAVMEMEKLEAETFALKMKQLDYDVQALRVSRAKRTSWQLQVHHAKLQYRVQTFNESIKAAKSFMAD